MRCVRSFRHINTCKPCDTGDRGVRSLDEELFSALCWKVWILAVLVLSSRCFECDSARLVTVCTWRLE